MSRKLVVAILALTVALTSCASPAADDASGKADGVTKLTVMTLAGTTSNAGIHLGIERGFFKEEGLELEITQAQAPPAAIAAVQGGQVDLAYATAIPALIGLSQGVKFKAAMAADGYSKEASSASDPRMVDPLSLYAHPNSGVTDYSDLGGKRVAVPARKAQFEIVITDAAIKAGVDPSTIEWVTLDFQSALQALKAGHIDVASLVEPFGREADSADMNFLGAPNVDFFGDGGLTSLWLTSQQVADSKNPAIQAFQRAIKKTNEYANTHKDEAVKKTAELTGLTGDKVNASYWPTTVTTADLEKVASKLVDLNFLQAPVDLDGFILPQP